MKLLAWIAVLSAGMCAAPGWSVHLHGAGPLRIGMSIAEVRRVLGDPHAKPVADTDAEDCTYIQTTKLPNHVGLMFEKGLVARVDVFKRGLRTASGAGVGD